MTADHRPLLHRLLLTAACAVSLALPVAAADGSDAAARVENAGAYLSARQAEAAHDFPAAAEWFAQALTVAPADPDLLQGLLLAQMALGLLDEAEVTATKLAEAGRGNPSVALALITVAAASDDPARVQDRLGGDHALGAAVDALVAGWAEQGLGQMNNAISRFDEAIAVPGYEPLGYYHKALALASAGDLEGADAILSGPAAGSIAGFRRGLLAHIQILSQLERNADALALFDRGFQGAQDSGLADLRRRLAAGEPVPFDIVSGMRQGIAEVFHTTASASGDGADMVVTLAFARAALHLRPEDTEIKLMVARTYDGLGQPALAAKTYALIPPEDPAFHLAEIGRANALRAAGDTDGAISVLTELSQSHAGQVQVHMALGDMLRRLDRFEEALAAYDAGIALVEGPAPWSWPLHYNRAICLERLGRFPEGVPSFRKALALNPGQPQVLNYLGYSWIDRGENLTEAVAMIEEAVKAAPDQGYIIDSLAWAYYRLGRFTDALAPMERASLLEPVDPIVTDHLGDVYWVNGRQLEARFQWRRALSFEPAEKDAERIRAKLERGLDAVLEQEKAGDGTSN